MKALKKIKSPKPRRRPRLPELLLDVSNKMAMAGDLSEALDVLVDITTSLVNAEQGSIFLNDAQTEELYTRIMMGRQSREIRMLNHLGIAGYVFKTAEALIIHDAYSDKRFNPEVDKKTGYVTRDILCVPLRTLKGEIIGVSELLNKKEGQFTTEDQELLEAIVKQAAIVLESRRTAENIERDRQQQLEMLRVVSEVSSEIKLGALLKKLIGTITRMLDAERSTLFLNDEKTNELYTEVGEGLGATQIRLPNHVGIAGTVFTSSQSVNIPHAYADLRFNPSFDKKTGFFTRSILCVPVINKDGKTIGVTQVLNKRGSVFTEQDEARLKAFTSQIAIALENAKLFDDVQNMKNYNESVLESMPSGVITLNEEQTIVTCNAAGLKIMRVQPDQILRRKAAGVFGGANAWVAEKVTEVEEKQTQHVTMDAEMMFDEEKISANITILPLVSITRKKLGSLIMIEDISGEKRLKSTMSRYMDPAIAEKLVKAGAEILGGQSSIATVLFSDIRSFTTLTEELGPQATVSLLNEYFTIMVDCIQYEGGMLDKFIGDAIMAVFGTPLAHDDDEDRAMRAAVNMLRELTAYNVRRTSEGKKPIDMGVGINTDTIVSGNIGSPRRMNYTVIGDGVNLASRLEGACKQYHARLLVSEFTFKKLRGTYRSREIDRVVVKGKTQPVGLFEIVDYHTDESFPIIMEVLNAFRYGLKSYRERRWDDAIGAFRQALEFNPADYASRMYIDRCEVLKASPPSGDWNGVWVMETK
ncbi:MAG: GAF domain-containing protein [Acidobacteria bacterium]|nr:GAF domain-containing protein [Acidobacteriota bacterium]